MFLTGWGLGVIQSLYFVGGIVLLVARDGARRLPRRLGLVCVVVGAVLHATWLVHRGWQSGHLPMTDSYETMVLLSWLVIAIYLIGLTRQARVGVGGVAGLLAALLLAISALISTEVSPLVPSLRSNWLLFHVATNFVAYASFTLAAGAAIARFFVALRSRERRATTTDRAQRLSEWDELAFRLVRFGFPLMTLGIATGAVWANVCWGSYWNWDPKETWAFVTWMVYAGYLHVSAPRWGHGALCAALVLVGFSSVIFTYLGVNVFLTSLHAYA